MTHKEREQWAFRTVVDVSSDFTEAWDQFRMAIALGFAARTRVPNWIDTPENCRRVLRDAYSAVLGQPHRSHP